MKGFGFQPRHKFLPVNRGFSRCGTISRRAARPACAPPWRHSSWSLAARPNARLPRFINAHFRWAGRARWCKINGFTVLPTPLVRLPLQGWCA